MFAAEDGAARVWRLVVEARLRSCHCALPKGSVVVAREGTGNGVSSRAADVEAHQGVASAERVAYEVAGPLIAQAASWAELHATLGQAGMQYTEKGSGAVIVVAGQAVKASRAGRAASRGQLERRLGPFEASEVVIAPRARTPAPGMSIEELDAFDAARAARSEDVAGARQERKSLKFEAVDGSDAALAGVMALLSAKARQLAQVPQHLRDIGSFRDGRGPVVGNGQVEIRPSGDAVPDVAIGPFAYRRHREAVLNGLRDRPSPSNASIVDGWVAQRLRAGGRDQAAVEAILMTEAPRMQSGVRRDWLAYSQRQADFAFAPQSTAYMAADVRRAERWKTQEAAAEADLWRATRRRMMAALEADLASVFVNRRMAEADMRARHKARLRALGDVRWGLRRMRRAGVVMAVLSAMVELAVVTPLIAGARAAGAAEERSLREAAARASTELKQARQALRRMGPPKEAISDRRAPPEGDAGRQPAKSRRAREADGQGL